MCKTETTQRVRQPLSRNFFWQIKARGRLLINSHKCHVIILMIAADKSCFFIKNIVYTIHIH